jgi:hypothetical protein
MYGTRAFSYAEPVLWNGLPWDIKIPPDLRTLKFRLKKHLFGARIALRFSTTLTYSGFFFALPHEGIW